MSDSKVQYPTIEVPGKGTFTVKFGMGAVYTLERQLGITPQEIGRTLRQMFPYDEATKRFTVGAIKVGFLFDILSACIWDQVHLEPRELADCFGEELAGDLIKVGKVVMEAFAKAPWSRAAAAPTPAAQDSPQTSTLAN